MSKIYFPYLLCSLSILITLIASFKSQNFSLSFLRKCLQLKYEYTDQGVSNQLTARLKEISLVFTAETTVEMI